MTVFYTYLWLRDDGTPYYAGKGKGYRAFTANMHICPPPSDRARVIIQEFESEHDAFAAEKFLISFYGRIDLGTGCLRNLTDGGEGASGHSAEARRKMREANQGIERPWLKGNKFRLGKRRSLSSETCRRIRQAKLGNKSKLGLKDSIATRAKKSAAVKLSWIARKEAQRA